MKNVQSLMKNNKFLGYGSTVRLTASDTEAIFYTTSLYCSYSAISYGCWQFGKEFRMVHTDLSPPCYLLHTVQLFAASLRTNLE
jgi:hypothetical protein